MTFDDKLARLESLMTKKPWRKNKYGGIGAGEHGTQPIIASVEPFHGADKIHGDHAANADAIACADLIVPLARALRDCADGLASAVENEYAATRHYPVMETKFQRDMEPVNRARALLAELDERLP